MFNAGAHRLPAPFVQELSRPGGGVVIPELLKRFLEKVSADRLQVVAEQVAQPEALIGFEVVAAFEQQPARFFQYGNPAFEGDAPRFSGTDFVQCLVHVCHDVEAIEDMQRL
jgi:hypothetical protein